MKKLLLIATVFAAGFAGLTSGAKASNGWLPASAAGKFTTIALWQSPTGPRISAFSYTFSNIASCTETLISATGAIQSGQHHELHGSTGNDWISFVTSKTSALCGKTLEPVPVFYGGTIHVFGNSGNDVIFGGLFSTDVFGENGNDNLFPSSKAQHIASGGNNNDIVDAAGQNTTTTLYGGEGDDILCGDSSYNPNARVKRMEGGNGYDRWCGDPDTQTGLNKRDCSTTGCDY